MITKYQKIRRRIIVAAGITAALWATGALSVLALRLTGTGEDLFFVLASAPF